ncbi:DNA methylase [Pseudomonas sp. RP23018S]|uniref:DNA methylase n=1 Tax=Pseudomonas sp. RP23018S TaxID=3096037 RepID=UPI002ACA72AD|nr:DNA methylase [Pseudomonas sp. RP23018S]MDZ5603679.1 DNA methylase [Pseudomonas sp. RP23018S]
MPPMTAHELAIHLTHPSDPGLFHWLVAAFLMGKRIRAAAAVEAYRQLVEQQGLDTPNKLAACAHTVLVRRLGQAGYARYDESTARRLRALATAFQAQMPKQLEALRAGELTRAAFERWLLTFEGIGPKTVEIFMREAARVFVFAEDAPA